MAVFGNHAVADEMGALPQPLGKRQGDPRADALRLAQLRHDPLRIHMGGGGDVDGLVEDKFNGRGRHFQEIAIPRRALHQMGVGEGAGAGKSRKKQRRQRVKRKAPHLRCDSLIAGAREARSAQEASASQKSLGPRANSASP